MGLGQNWIPRWRAIDEREVATPISKIRETAPWSTSSVPLPSLAVPSRFFGDPFCCFQDLRNSRNVHRTRGHADVRFRAEPQRVTGLCNLAKDLPEMPDFRSILTAFPALYIEAVIILRRRVRLVLLGSQHKVPIFNTTIRRRATCGMMLTAARKFLITHPYPNFLFFDPWGTPSFPPVLL